MKISEFDAVLRDLENEIARLRSLYEQYFQGLERRPPIRLRERLDRQVRALRRGQPQNTAMRFKYQTIFQRWITFTQYWDRISRRIEEGTYKRDIQRAQRRRAQIERAPAAEQDEGPGSVDVSLDLDMDLDQEISAALEALRANSSHPAPAPISLPDMDLDPHPAPRSIPPAKVAPKRPAPPPPPRSGPRPPPPPPRPRSESLRDDDVRKIFDRFVEARKKTGQRPDGVSYEKLKSQIRKMEPELRRKHAGKRIDFEVVVRNGRVGLKPVAKPGSD